MHRDSILIALSDQQLRRTFKEALDKEYQLIDAKHGFEAVRLTEANNPSLVILDIEITGLNGIDCCRRIKSGAKTKDIPVILVHSRTNTEDIIFGLQAGADDYITKPINAADVLARVDSHLNYNKFLEGLEQNDLKLLLELSNSISTLRNPNKILSVVVKKVANILGVDRCSIVCMTEVDKLTIKASNDLNVNGDLKVDLDGYPEIRKALETRKAVVVNDTTSDPLMAPVREQITKRGLNSIFVVPIIKKECVIGSLFLGTASKLSSGVSDRTYKLCHLVANISANALENAILFESMSTAKDIFEDFVTRDGLTRLFTHRHFYGQVEKELSRAKRYNLPTALVFFNVDDFRKVNDNYGHMLGDEVLKQVGRIVKGIIRDIDVPARYSGDEFAILLPNTDLQGAFNLARRLLKQVSDHDFDVLKNHQVTISVGVSSYGGELGKTADQLIQEATQAMRKAKVGGKMRVATADAA